MPIWTNGTDLLLVTGWGLARQSGRAQSVRPFSTAGLRRDQDPPEVVSFIVLDAEGKRVLVQREGEPPSIWTHGEAGGRLTPCEITGVEAVAAAPSGPMVALTADRTGGAARKVLRRAHLDGTELVLGEVIPVPEAPRLTWADSIMKEGEGWPEQPGEDDDDEPEEPPFDPRALSLEAGAAPRPYWQGRVRLSANRFGIGVSSTYSGLVAVLDRETLAFRLVARVPALRDQFDLYTLPMAAGMLVTLVANYRHSEFVFVDASGAVRANRHQLGKEMAWGAGGPGFAWDDATALVNQTLHDDEIHALKLPGLEAKRFGKDPGILIDGGSIADGATHVIAVTQRNFARPKNWQLARWTKRGVRWTATELEMPDFRPIELPPTPAGPERAKGTPTLGVAADPAIAWRAPAGAELVLRLRVENRGGPARGLAVEVGGAAIADGTVSAQLVSVEGGEASGAMVRKGSVARGELPACLLDAGFAPPSTGRNKGPTAPLPPPPAVVLQLRVRAERAGQGLMSVRIGPLGATGTTGSGMIGRSFLVEGG